MTPENYSQQTPEDQPEGIWGYSDEEANIIGGIQDVVQLIYEHYNEQKHSLIFKGLIKYVKLFLSEVYTL